MTQGSGGGRRAGSRHPRIQAAIERAAARRAGTMPDAAGMPAISRESDFGGENDQSGVDSDFDAAQGRSTRPAPMCPQGTDGRSWGGDAPVGYRPRPARTTREERRWQVWEGFRPFLKPNPDEEGTP